ncbi:hypothetical protein [Methanobrevibacter sp.]|uniref:hypothetical protein n=1 Tax=Methanobrevibacter sp. TaxID=66852 RepID=UPI003863B825
MSFDRRFELPNFDDMDVDLTACENCDFECGTIGYCLDECGENYIICTLFMDKGYNIANKDWGRSSDGKLIPGVEIYKNQTQKFMKAMSKLGHTCTTYNHPLGKSYLNTVIIDGGVEPIDLALDFLEMEAIK